MINRCTSVQDDEYDVERVVAKRVVKVSVFNPSWSCMYSTFTFQSEEQVLVTWSGYPVHTASWVPVKYVNSSALRSVSYIIPCKVSIVFSL